MLNDFLVNYLTECCSILNVHVFMYVSINLLYLSINSKVYCVFILSVQISMITQMYDHFHNDICFKFN